MLPDKKCHAAIYIAMQHDKIRYAACQISGLGDTNWHVQAEKCQKSAGTSIAKWNLSMKQLKIEQRIVR